MRFINEYTSQEDIDKFELDEVVNKYINVTASYKHHWIVDKDTDSWLLPIKQLNNSESIWILHYKNTNIEIELFKTKDGNYDLISIAPNSLDNVDIISTLREALKVLGSNNIIYSTPKKTNFEEKEETKKSIEPVSKRKFTYFKILIVIIIFAILFFIQKDSNHIISTIKNDTNITSTKNQTTKPTYDLYSVIQESKNNYTIYGMYHNDLSIMNKILSFNSIIRVSQVDKYGNIYWSDITNQAIYKANPDGTNIRKIVSVPKGPTGIAIDNEGEKIFWEHFLVDKQRGEIGYADLSGNNLEIILSDKKAMYDAREIFYDYVYYKLYIADQGGGQIVAIDLKTKETKHLAYAKQPVSIAVDYKNKRVVWTDSSGYNISSANFDGSNKKVLIQFDEKRTDSNGLVIHTIRAPGALTIDTINNRLIYEYNNLGTIVIETSNLDGTDRKIEKKLSQGIVQSLYFTNESSYKNGDI